MKTLILISGKMRSGKNQFAEFLNINLMTKGKRVRSDLFANDLKKGCEEDFSYMTKQINDHINKIKEELSYSRIDVNSLKTITPLLNDLMVTRPENWYEDKTMITRLLLQTYGTQIFRDRVNKNHWVDQVLQRAINCDEEYTLVTDARFENEIEHVKEVCSLNNIRVFSVRIERDIPLNNLYEHDSEKGLDNYKHWDLIVNNNKTLDDLQNSASIFVDLIV